MGNGNRNGNNKMCNTDGEAVGVTVKAKSMETVM